jgi:VanZ family protein
MKKKILSAVLLILWMIVIFLFSSQPSNNSTILTNNFISKIMHFTTFNTISISDLNAIIRDIFLPVRKVAHFSEYFVLGILSYNFFCNIKKTKYIMHFSILFCFTYALSDEVHQLYVIGRNGSLIDVVIDTCGALLGIVIFSKVVKRKFINLYYKKR